MCAVAILTTCCVGFDKIDSIFQSVQLAQQKVELLRVQDWLSKRNYDEQQYTLSRTQYIQQSRWLLDSTDFRNFVGGSGEEQWETLFCHGEPGVGKTLLTSMVIANIQENLAISPPTGTDQSRKRQAVAFLYLHHKDNPSVVEMLAEIIKQLLEKVRIVPPSIQSLHNKYRNLSTDILGSDATPQFAAALQSFICGCYGRVFIVIDALDENVSAGALLNSLFTVQKVTAVRIFATARSSFDKKYFCHGLIRNVTGDSEDVKSYVRQRVEGIRTLKVDDVVDDGMLEDDDADDDDDTSIRTIREEVINKVSEAAAGRYV